jgi:hypothetical protein
LATKELKWGLLPDQVKATITRREWDKTSNLKARMLGERSFPITLHLNVPSGKVATSDLRHYQRFIREWKDFPYQQFVRWEERSYKKLLIQQVPCALDLASFDDLVTFLGESAQKRSQHWQAMMAPFLNLNDGLFNTLVKNLLTLDTLDEWTSDKLAQATQQLQEGMGKERYLRALPLTGIHSKLIESYIPLLTDVLDFLYHGAIKQAGGLMPWLGCLDVPVGWLNVRPLCEKTQEKIGGFSILKLPIDELRKRILPAANILIVENDQTGFGLPYLPDTIAVFGGGKNIAWSDASWLKDKNVAYWGDIDSWGLEILSNVRKHIPHVSPLMMDHTTLSKFKRFSTHEDKSVESCPSRLTSEEKTLFETLKDNVNGLNRLEQEFYAADYIEDCLYRWLKRLDG